MKERIKYILFGILIAYLIFLVFSLFTNYHSNNKKVEITKNTNYIKSMEINNGNINQLKTINMEQKDSMCLNKIEDLYNYSIKTNIEGKINLKDYYKKYYCLDCPTLLNKYSKLLDTCEIKNTEYANTDNVLAATMILEENNIKLSFNYELKLKDYLLRSVAEPSLTNVEFKSIKNIESETIKKALNKLEVKYEKTI